MKTAPSGAAPISATKPMSQVLRVGWRAHLVAVPVGSALGWLARGTPGAWGAAIGMLIPAIFFGITAAGALLTANLSPSVLGATILGSWLLKIILLLVALAWLRQAGFYDSGVLAGSLLLGTIGSLTLEALVVARTKVPYLDT